MLKKNIHGSIDNFLINKVAVNYSICVSSLAGNDEPTTFIVNVKQFCYSVEI